jgi:RNA polymerase nonessential primary-like sigma factor
MTSSKYLEKELEEGNKLVRVQFKSPKAKNEERKDSVGAYLKEIGRGKLLKPEEEVKYAKSVKRLFEIEKTRSKLEKTLNRKPEEAELCEELKISIEQLRKEEEQGYFGRKVLIERNLRMVVCIAKRYRNQGLSFQDLIQEGSLGLIKGVEKFEIERGYKLSTYAYWWIRQGITRGIAEQSREIRLPVHVSELISRKNKAQVVLSQKLGRIPTKKEVASELGITTERFNELLKWEKAPLSLDTKIGDFRDQELWEIIIDEKSVSPEEEAIVSEIKDQVRELIKEMTEQERTVMTLRFGLEDGVAISATKIAERLDLSRQRVNQIEKNAKGKIKKALSTRMSQAREIMEARSN